MIWSKVFILIIQQCIEQLRDIVNKRLVIEALSDLREADAEQKNAKCLHLSKRSRASMEKIHSFKKETAACHLMLVGGG